jgi:transcriptional regulator with XRE-family HTH domain
VAGHSINVERLTREMFVRGLDEEALAGIAGVSNATVSSALKGKPVQMGTLMKMAKAISLRPSVPELVAISPYEPDPEVEARLDRAKMNLVVDGVIERILDHVRRGDAEMERLRRRHRSE